MALNAQQVQLGLEAAFARLLDVYRATGGDRYPGFVAFGDPKTYKGPTFWSEGDCQFRFALALEQEFPRSVHVEAPVAGFMFKGFDPNQHGKNFVDIVVSHLDDFDEGKDVFAQRTHELFVEVKFVGRSSRGAFKAVGLKAIFEGVPRDIGKLKVHLAERWCRAAALLLVADHDYLEDNPGAMSWDPAVAVLLVSPAALRRRDAAARLRCHLPFSCPACGSPRLAVLLHGMPTPEWEQAAQRGDVVLTGCEVFGDDRDGTYTCLDCPHSDGRRIARGETGDAGMFVPAGYPFDD